jgi:hypothetical protein
MRNFASLSFIWYSASILLLSPNFYKIFYSYKSCTHLFCCFFITYCYIKTTFKAHFDKFTITHIYKMNICLSKCFIYIFLYSHFYPNLKFWFKSNTLQSNTQHLAFNIQHKAFNIQCSTFLFTKNSNLFMNFFF